MREQIVASPDRLLIVKCPLGSSNDYAVPTFTYVGIGVRLASHWKCVIQEGVLCRPPHTAFNRVPSGSDKHIEANNLMESFYDFRLDALPGGAGALKKLPPKLAQ